MKKRTKIIVVIILILVAIGLISSLFAVQILNRNISDENIFIEHIVEPDRIVYRNKDGKYYEFLKNTDKYNTIKELISKSLSNYNESGNTLSDDDIDKIHGKSFIEFDYETASKNYIIPLEENDEKDMIKLGTTGGMVVSTNLKNLNKMKNTLDNLSEGEKAYELNYKEMISRNTLNSMEYRYLQQFKQINYKIYQVKIDNIETYELYKEMCNLAFDEEITKDIFNDNDLILTLSLVPKIDVKVSVGNIKYTYEKMTDVNYQYTAHLLIVSKIVNTNCIYNTDLSDVEQQVDLNNFQIEYDKQVDNLNPDIFVIDFDDFYNRYQNATSSITKNQAEEIAEKGFEEAKRVVGEYNKDTQKCEEIEVNPNNFFTRKYNEGDKVESYKVKVYAFSREDDMGNGVKIYVDKKLGKIVGATAFGD